MEQGFGVRRYYPVQSQLTNTQGFGYIRVLETFWRREK